MPAVSLLPVEALHQKSVPLLVMAARGVGPPPEAILNPVVELTPPASSTLAIVRVDAAVPEPMMERKRPLADCFRSADSGRPERHTRGYHCWRQDRESAAVGFWAGPQCRPAGNLFQGVRGWRQLTRPPSLEGARPELISQQFDRVICCEINRQLEGASGGSRTPRQVLVTGVDPRRGPRNGQKGNIEHPGLNGRTDYRLT